MKANPATVLSTRILPIASLLPPYCLPAFRLVLPEKKEEAGRNKGGNSSAKAIHHGKRSVVSVRTSTAVLSKKRRFKQNVANSAGSFCFGKPGM
jgi:hypothetical protein